MSFGNCEFNKEKYMGSWKLNRTKQCEKCPWKVSVSATPPNYEWDDKVVMPDHSSGEGTISMIPCLESTKDSTEYCVAWIQNQVGGAHNPRLRNNMHYFENGKDVKTIGKQHSNCTSNLLRRERANAESLHQ
jgi:hypothetical protein